jgi:spermidine/putrescine-binding protein
MKFPYYKILIFTLLGLIALISGCQSTPEVTSAPVLPPPEPTIAPPPQFDTGDIDEIAINIRYDYLDPDLYAVFQDQTGIELIEDNFTRDEELLARLQGLGNIESWALIFPSDYMVNIMKRAGMLATLEKGNIPNLANLDDRFKNAPSDPGNDYCIPYQWGTTGIGYNAAELGEINSWALIFESDPSAPSFGRTTMLNNPRASFAAALLYLGYDVNTTNEAELEEAKQALIRAKSGLAAYANNSIASVASGENLAAHGRNREFLTFRDEFENLSYTIPREGAVIWVDYMCIPITASADKKAAAEQFMNFILDPNIGGAVAAYNMSASPNGEANKLIGDYLINDPNVYPPAEEFDRLYFLKDLGAFEAVYAQKWEEVKSAP